MLKSLLTHLTILMVCNIIIAQNSPPEISASGNQMYCADNPMPVVTSVSITDPDPADNTLDEAFVQISEGYVQGSDNLTLTGVHPNITAVWSAVEGKLTLTGTATFAEYENAIEDVVFQTTQTSFSDDKFFSINLGNANFLPSTGHYYFYVSDVGVTWSQARASAAQMDYFGLQGYLVTITTEEEAQLTGEQSAGTGWIGASDAQSEGVWEWVTGPEAGQVFWIGGPNGTPQNNEFSYWNQGEPNNFGDEDYAHVTDESVAGPGLIGSWNDLPNAGEVNVTSPYHPQGYLVEFGGMPNDPDINLSASTTITTPRVDFTTSEVCEQGNVNITLTTNVDEVLWYESEASATSINTGFSYNTIIAGNTTYWVSPRFAGCTSGGRIPIAVTVNPLPEAQDITISQCDDNGNGDGRTVFNLNSYSNAITGGNLANAEVRFFLEAGLVTELNGDSYENLFNSQVIYAQVTNQNTGCISTAEVTLQVGTGESINAFLELCDDLGDDGVDTFNLAFASNQIMEGLPSQFLLSYHETYEDALLGMNALPFFYSNTQPYHQIIYVRVRNGNDCYGIGEVELSVLPSPKLQPNEEVFYCVNTFPEFITLEAGLLEDNPNDFTYTWSTGATTPSIQVNQTGVYTVEVNRLNWCEKTRTITVSPSNVATIAAVEISEVSENNTVTIFATGEGSYEYALDDISGPYQQSNIFENIPPGVYTLYVRDSQGNCGIVTEQISVVGYPKFFTPNGDGDNDRWTLKGFATPFPFTAEVNIYNRYGKLITTLNRSNLEWDGNFNGKKLPSDDYWFVATLEDGRSFNGHFALVR